MEALTKAKQAVGELEDQPMSSLQFQRAVRLALIAVLDVYDELVKLRDVKPTESKSAPEAKSTPAASTAAPKQ